AGAASQPMTTPTVTSHAEKSAHIMSAVHQYIRSVRSVPTKQTIGKGTSIGWIGILAIRAVERAFSPAIGSPSLNGQALVQDSLDMNGGFINVVRIANRSRERSVPGFWSRTFLNMEFSCSSHVAAGLAELLVVEQRVAGCSDPLAPSLVPNCRDLPGLATICVARCRLAVS